MSNNRPLSPHLQIYKPQLTSVLSILHRGTGVVIALGALIIAYWFWTAAGDAQSYQGMQSFLGSFLGKALIFIWSACTFYHLCNGIRHLLWDVGYGFELDKAYLTGKIVVITAVILTVLVWLL